MKAILCERKREVDINDDVVKKSRTLSNMIGDVCDNETSPILPLTEEQYDALMRYIEKGDIEYTEKMDIDSKRQEWWLLLNVAKFLDMKTLRCQVKEKISARKLLDDACQTFPRSTAELYATHGIKCTDLDNVVERLNANPDFERQARVLFGHYPIKRNELWNVLKKRAECELDKRSK